MADLTVQDISDEDGATITFANAAGGGDKFVWDSRAMILLRNDDASAKTVTFTPGTTEVKDSGDGELTRSAIAITLAAGAEAIVPPLPRLFRHTSDSDKVHITYSAVTSVSLAVLRVQ